MSSLDLLHTYSSDALAQGILKYILYVCRVLTYYTHIQVTHWLSDIKIYIVCMSGFDLIHTYASDALAQGILKYILYVCRVLT